MTGKARAIAVVGLASLALAAPAAAKTYEVTKCGDPTPNGCKKKDCSLREAVIAANGHPGPDKIALPEKKTYKLGLENAFSGPGKAEDAGQTGDLDITGPLRVIHKGKARRRWTRTESIAPSTCMRVGPRPSSGSWFGAATIRTAQSATAVGSRPAPT